MTKKKKKKKKEKNLKKTAFVLMANETRKGPHIQ